MFLAGAFIRGWLIKLPIGLVLMPFVGGERANELADRAANIIMLIVAGLIVLSLMAGGSHGTAR